MRLLLSTLLVSVSSLASARSLTVSAPDWPPFYIHEDNSKGKGMAWEILEICASRIDKNAVFDMYPIRRMFKYMERGELDVNLMSFKPDRAKTLDYGKELVFENQYDVWARASLKKPIKSIADLNNLSIAQMVGLRPSDEFRSWFDNRLKSNSPIETLQLNHPEQVFEMLAHDRIDATVISSQEARWRTKRMGISSKVKDTGFSLKSHSYFVVIAKESPLYKQDPGILGRMDQCVRDLKANGTWARLKAHYDL